jgi:hypothetical protein
MTSRKIRIAAFVFAGMVLLDCASWATASDAAPVTCTNASIKGAYGFILTGADASGKYEITVGQIKASGTGTLTGTETVNDYGVVDNNATLTGTYSLGASCTGTATITPKGGTTTNYSVVFDSVTKQIEMAETDSGVTRSGYAMAQGAATCSTAGVKGTYGFHGFGLDASLGGTPTAFDGQYILDGAGNMSGTGTTSFGGTISTLAISGTYTVGSNCQGTLDYQFNGSVNLNIVVVNGGKTFMGIDTASGIVASGVAQQ